jgi:hypothetical protein
MKLCKKFADIAKIQVWDSINQILKHIASSWIFVKLNDFAEEVIEISKVFWLIYLP